jgi:hypothetical protein
MAASWNVLRSSKDIRITGCGYFLPASAAVHVGDPVLLLRNKDNEALKHHANAVQVYHKGLQIGHLSRSEADSLGPWMDDSGHILTATGVISSVGDSSVGSYWNMRAQCTLRIDLNEIHKEMIAMRESRNKMKHDREKKRLEEEFHCVHKCKQKSTAKREIVDDFNSKQEDANCDDEDSVISEAIL